MSAPDSTFDGFPFHAVFGHDDLKLALILCGVDPSIGGVLSNTTIARSSVRSNGSAAPRSRCASSIRGFNVA